MADFRQRAHPGVDTLAADRIATAHQGFDALLIFLQAFTQSFEALQPKPNFRQKSTRFLTSVMLAKTVNNPQARGVVIWLTPFRAFCKRFNWVPPRETSARLRAPYRVV